MQKFSKHISPDKGIQTNEIIDLLTNDLDKAHGDKVFIHDIKDDKVVYQLNDKLLSRDIISNDGEIAIGNNYDEVVETTYHLLNEANGNEATLKQTEETDLENENIVGDLVANYATLNDDDKKQVVSQLNLNTLSDEEMSEYKALKAEQKEKLNSLRKSVVANYDNLTPDMVVNMTCETLEALNNSVTKSVDYSAKNGSGLNTNTEYNPVSVLLAKKKEK